MCRKLACTAMKLLVGRLYLCHQEIRIHQMFHSASFGTNRVVCLTLDMDKDISDRFQL